ncbi:MAG: sulfatase-like hydrolase/transferase [Betaproteobacteria bacterium]
MAGLSFSDPPEPRNPWVRGLTRPTLQPWQFLLLYTAYTALAFQWPTFAYAAAQLNLQTWEGWRTLATLGVLLTLLMVLLLGLPLLLSRRLFKLMAVLLLLGNGLASYFVHTYQVVLNVDMMGNVFNTRFDEASALFHPSMLAWVGVLSGLPAWWVWRVEWAPHRPWVRIGHWVLGVALAAAWLYVNASSWLWLDRHMSRIGSMTPPWSYVVNSVRFVQRERAANRPLALLPDLAPDAAADTRKRVVVLVIGESARAANFSLYGYARPTNPQLSLLPIEVLQARACASYTTAALACMLSPRGAKVDEHPPEETLPAYLHRHGVDVEWRSNNFGEPRMTVTSRLQKGELLARCEQPAPSLSERDRFWCAQPRDGAFDAALLLGLEQRIAASDRARVLIVLHQAGSHGPAYHEKVPPGSETFTPVCKSVNLGSCPSGTLVNAYDNSIVHTDALLAEITTRLGRLQGWDSTLVYVSDHGESLGEGGLYLHGTPAALAPDVQMDIPFLIWRSTPPARGAAAPPAPSNAAPAPAPSAGPATLSSLPRRREGRFSHDHVFHTVMGALGLRSGAYRAEQDVFQHEPR